MKTISKRRALLRALSLVTAGAAFLAAPALLAQDLYWTANGSQIMGAAVDGSNVVEVFDGTGMAGTAVDVAVTATHIYWTDENDSTAGGVWRANRDGSGASLFIANPTGSKWAPQFIAIDETNDKLYFSDRHQGLFSAKLSDGTNVTSLGSPSGGSGTTGLALRGSNELLSVTGNSGNIYATNISGASHSLIESHWGGGSSYGLAFDAGSDTVYVTTSSGELLSHTIGGSTQWLENSLASPLGLTFSTTKSHLVYVEAGSGTISARHISTGDTLTLVNGGATFGVAIDGDPEEFVPPPLPAVSLPIVDTFDHGTVGSSVVDQPTSDGKAIWRAIDVSGAGVEVVYGDDAGDGILRVRSDNGLANLYLEANVRDIENYRIRIGKLTVRGLAVTEGTGGTVDGHTTLGARRISSDAGHAYRWSPATFAGADRLPFWFRPGSADTDSGNIANPKSPVTYGDVELRVEGGKQRFYSKGIPVDSFWRDTEADFGVEDNQRVVQIRIDSIADTNAFVEMELSDISIEDWTPAPPPPAAVAGWQLVDDFDNKALGEIHTQGNWTTTNSFVDVIDNPYGDGKVLAVSYGSASHLITIPEGDTGTVFFRARPFGNDNFSFVTSRSDVMTNTGTSAGQLAFRAHGRLDIIDNETGNHIKPLDVYDPHTWYDVWLVINNSAKTVKYYVRGGAFASQTLLDDESGQTEFNHRSTADGDIRSFGFQGFGREPMLVDQIWINAIEEDLTDPMSTPVDTEPATSAGPLLAHEGFDYSPGPIAGQNGGSGWIYKHFVYRSDPSPQVADPGFILNDLQVIGNRLVVDNPGSTTGAYSYRWLDTNAIDPSLIDARGQLGSVGSTYISLLAKGGDPTTPSFWGFSLHRGDQERIFLGKGQNETGGWHFREQSAPDLNRVITNLSLTDQHFLVIKLDQAAAKAYLFANPDPAAGEPAGESAVAVLDLTSTIGNWGFNNMRVTGGESGFAVDEVRVGTTWDSVTPTGSTSGSGFAAWQDEQFGSGADPSISGATADPDGDGIENLIEYALAGDPLVANRNVLPSEDVEDVGGQNYLTLIFTRPTGITDVSYAVDASADLVVWDATPVQLRVTDNDNGTETVVYRDADPIAGSERRFLRLGVSQN